MLVVDGLSRELLLVEVVTSLIAAVEETVLLTALLARVDGTTVCGANFFLRRSFNAYTCVKDIPIRHVCNPPQIATHP